MAQCDLLKPLMVPLNDRLSGALQPGVNTVSWLSNIADEFMRRANDAVSDWELTVRRATELVEQRIFARFRDIERTELCELSPSDEPFTVEEFTDYVRVRCSPVSTCYEVQ